MSSGTPVSSSFHLCSSGTSPSLRDVASPSADTPSTHEAALSHGKTHPCVDMGCPCDTEKTCCNLREDTAMTSITEGLGLFGHIDVPITSRTNIAAPGSITYRIDEEDPCVPRTQMLDRSLLGLPMSKVCLQDQIVASDPKHVSYLHQAHCDTGCLKTGGSLFTGVPSEAISTVGISPLTQTPIGPPPLNISEDHSQLDDVFPYVDAQHFMMTREYGDTLMGAPGQMMMTVSIKAPESTCTEWPATSPERSVYGKKLAATSVDQHELPTSPIVAPIPVVSPSCFVDASDMKYGCRESTCSSGHAELDKEPEIQLPLTSLTPPPLCRAQENVIKETVLVVEVIPPEIEKFERGRPCLLGHCMCDTALSLCGKLQRFMNDHAAFQSSADTCHESPTSTSDVMVGKCSTPQDKCKETNASAQPVSQTICSDALSTEAIILCSPGPPVLQRSLVDSFGNDMLPLHETDMRSDDLARCDADSQNPRIYLSAQLGSQADLLQPSTTQSTRTAHTMVETLIGPLPDGADASASVAVTIFDKPEREGTLPMPPRQVLGELPCDIAHPGKEARTLLSLANKLTCPESPKPSRNVCSPAPQMPTPQAARYAGGRDFDINHSSAIGKKRSRRRKSSKENVGQNSAQQLIKSTEASQPKSIGLHCNSNEKSLVRSIDL